MEHPIQKNDLGVPTSQDTTVVLYTVYCIMLMIQRVLSRCSRTTGFSSGVNMAGSWTSGNSVEAAGTQYSVSGWWLGHPSEKY